jgi:uncharacterized protein (DUF1697 family)
VTAWVALLRGINVGTAKRVAMADLRRLLEDLGYQHVKTVLNSGNAAFATDGTEAAIAADVERAIGDGLGVDVGVVVRSAGDLAAIVDANPFVARGVDQKVLHCLFASAPLPDLAFDAATIAPDEIADGDRVRYLHLPDGVMGSRIPDLPPPTGVVVTQRTWNTVVRLQSALPLED